jgi:hypothetical protein
LKILPKKYFRRALMFKINMIAFAAALSIKAPAASLISNFHDSHATLRFGTMSYTNVSGGEAIPGGGMSLNYEYSRQMTLSSALILGWRQVTDAATQRDGYHSAYGGYRMFPFGLGIPLTSSLGDAVIGMDSSYKLYGEVSLGLGRMFFKPIDVGAAGDLSADSLTVALGGGVLMHFFSRWGVDFQFMYHLIQARGGTADSLMLAGNGISILIGNSYLF